MQGQGPIADIQKTAKEFYKLQMILQNQMADQANAGQGQAGVNSQKMPQLSEVQLKNLCNQMMPQAIHMQSEHGSSNQ